MAALARVWLKTATALSAACWQGAPDGPQSFAIRSGDPAQHLEVRYYLTGPFGGYGAYVSGADEDAAWHIPLRVDPLRVDPVKQRPATDGTPALRMKAILYAPGCQFSLLSVDLAASTARSATFERHPLPTITLEGRIWPAPATGHSFDVAINYLAQWDHAFFGFADGIVQSFTLAQTPLQTDGAFKITIPDFSQ